MLLYISKCNYLISFEIVANNCVSIENKNICIQNNEYVYTYIQQIHKFILPFCTVGTEHQFKNSKNAFK